MLTLYQAKPAFQNCLRPMVQQLADWGRTPNEITLLAMALSIAEGIAIASFPDSPYPLVVLPVVLLLRMALNAIDGLLAREHDRTSHLGFVLNELGDVVSDLCLYLPFARISEINPWGVITVVILAMLTEFAGVLGQVLTQVRSYHGPFGKSDRALVFGTLGFVLGGGLLPSTGLNWIWPLLSGLAGLTILNRLRTSLQEVTSC